MKSDTATPKRMSLPAVAVLKAVADGCRYGFDIMDATRLPSGTVYPVLGRFDEAGLLRSQWERGAIAHREKRPPRRYYEITAAGARALASAIEYYRTVGGLLPGVPRTARG